MNKFFVFFFFFLDFQTLAFKSKTTIGILSNEPKFDYVIIKPDGFVRYSIDSTEEREKKKNSRTIYSGSEALMYLCSLLVWFVCTVFSVFVWSTTGDRWTNKPLHRICVPFLPVPLILHTIFIWKASNTTKALIISCDGTRISSYTYICIYVCFRMNDESQT